MKTSKRDLTFLIIIVLVWGLGYSALELGYTNGWNPYSLLFFRVLVAYVASFLLCFKQKFWKDKELLKVGIKSGILYFCANVCQFLGQQFTSVANTGLLTCCTVILVPLFSATLNRTKLSVRVTICCATAFIGAIILSVGGSLGLNIGDLLCFLGAVFFSLHVLFIEKNAKKHNPIAITCVTNKMMVLLSGVLLLFNLDGAIGKPIGILSFVYLGLLSSVLCFCLQQQVLKTTPAYIASLVLSLEGCSAAIFGIILFKEAITWNLLVGGGIMVLSTLISQISFKKKKEEITNATS